MESRFMTRAIELARIAAKKGEVPVGAVVVKDGSIIGEGYNMREQKHNALSHAETEAINAACNAPLTSSSPQSYRLVTSTKRIFSGKFA